MRRFLLLAVMFCVAIGARAQYARGDFSLTTATGQAVSGAQVYILQQPADLTAFTPTIAVFGSPTGSGTTVCGASGGQIGNPLSTDQFGHACGYFSPGTYTICYTSSRSGTQCYQDQTFNGATGGSVINASNMTAFQLNNEFWVAGAAVSSAPLCPNGGTTQLECTWNAANAWSNANSSNTLVHLMPGINTTTTGLAATQNYMPQLQGDANYGSMIRQISPISNPVVSYGCGLSANSVNLKDFMIDADFNAPSDLYIGQMNVFNVDGVTVLGANGTGNTANFVQMGDNTCGAGQGSLFEGHVSHLSIQGRGTGPASWAAATCTQSGGVPSCSISNGGSYHWNASHAFLVGYKNGTSDIPCTTMGTITPTFTQNGTWTWGLIYYQQTLATYTLSSVTLSGFSGCSGNMYLFVPDQPSPAYGLYLPTATDMVFDMTVVANAGTIAAVYNNNTANEFHGLHTYNNHIGFQAVGGGNINNYDCDSNLIMMQVVGSATLQERGCSVFYPSAALSKFNGAVVADLSADTGHQSTFIQNTVVDTSTDWHAFLQSDGPTDQTGNWPGSLIETGSPTLNPFGNVRHDTSMNAVLDTVGSDIPATASANHNSPFRAFCANVWNGTTSEQHCWTMQFTTSTSGIPTGEIFSISAPSNALAPVSGRTFLFSTPSNALANGTANVNSITLGLRGSYGDGSLIHSFGWNLSTSVPNGTAPNINLQINPSSACPGTCSITTNARWQASIFEMTNGGFLGDLQSTLTANRTYTMPDATGAVPVAPAAVITNHATCWKATGQIGYCSSQPDASGICTCN